MDQRCHGASAKLDGFSSPHTLAASATDIAEVSLLSFVLQIDVMGTEPCSILFHSRKCHVGTYVLTSVRNDGCWSIVQLMHDRTGGAGPDMLIGHSLGGKVMLQYLAQGGTAGLPLPKQAQI